jgi:hypothetical protein
MYLSTTDVSDWYNSLMRPLLFMIPVQVLVPCGEFSLFQVSIMTMVPLSYKTLVIPALWVFGFELYYGTLLGAFAQKWDFILTKKRL